MSKVCPDCGWYASPFSHHRCDPEAGATASALIAAVPEAEATKLGYGDGRVVLGQHLEEHDFALIFEVEPGTLKWHDVTCFRHRLTVEDAADLVRTLLAWRKRCEEQKP